MKITLKIKKYNPEKDTDFYWREFEIEAEETDRIMDVLHKARWYQDGTLAFRRSCGHGICGSCAMLINGENRLACMTLVSDVNYKKPIRIEALPAPTEHIQKDMAIDQTSFFDKYQSIKPWLINDEPPPQHRERPQSAEEQALIDESTQCILCGACTYSCPSTWADPEYLGPAAMLKAYRFIFDSRDRGAQERLAILDSKQGLFKCYTIFNCVHACPKEINITWHLGELKKRLAQEKY